MCGIIGTFSSNKERNSAVAKKMADAIIHRGPDDDGYFADDHIGLGMRRLSIIDLATGEQPIWTDNNRLCIFYNGEIYNYKELRSDLENKGVTFKTHTDTEVILKLYEREGESILAKLRGMFAFAIYDTQIKTTFLARDCFGIKPLYYGVGTEGKIFGFGSEIKALLEDERYIRKINDDAVLNYLSFQYNPLLETFFKGIFKLPPGHTLSITSDGSYTIKKYFEFSFTQDEALDQRVSEQKIKDIIENSVAHHTIADVPVGSFLSGGIDSGAIATLVQKESKEKIHTFTIGFKERSETNEAREVSDAIGSIHHEFFINPDEYFEALPKAIWHFDEPVADPSAIALYFLARESRRNVKVVLSGEGADELFGGYTIYQEPIMRRVYGTIAKIFYPISWLLLQLPFSFKGKAFLGRVFSPMRKWYIGNATVFTKKELQKIWKGDPKKQFDLGTLYNKCQNTSESTQMQYIDINTWLVGDILAKADKMTMAHSLELRVPFLDREIAEFTRTIPDRLKFSWTNTKILLRGAMKGIIPDTTKSRRKLGFPTPVNEWFAREDSLHHAVICKKITESQYLKNILHMNAVARMIENHTKGDGEYGRKLYALLVLAIWHEVFFGVKA